jgi:hypothetical protein
MSCWRKSFHGRCRNWRQRIKLNAGRLNFSSFFVFLVGILECWKAQLQ